MAVVVVTYRVTYDDSEQPLRHASDITGDAAETLINILETEEVNAHVEVVDIKRAGEYL